jgi:hypothetical protein
LKPIDPGTALTTNDNASIPITDKGVNAIDSSGQFVLAASNGKGEEGVDLPPGTYYFKGISISGNSTARISGPTTIYVDGPVNLTGGNIVNSTQIPANLKILILSSDLVNLSANALLHAAIYAPNATVGYYAFSGNGNTADPAGIKGMVIANMIEMSASGGIRADLALSDYATALTGVTVATGSGNPIPPAGWQAITSSEVDISSSTITGNQCAVHLATSGIFASRFTQFSSNREWGLSVNGPFDLDTCTISDNVTGGLYIKGASDGDFSFVDLTMQNNTQYGIFVMDCQLTFDQTMLGPNTISGSPTAVASQGGSLTLDGVTISGGSVAGVYTVAGTLIVKNSTLSGSGYGLAADQSTVTVEDCTLDQNVVGLYSNQSTTLNATNTTITNNSFWGAVVNASSAPGAKATFSGCTIQANVGGVTVVDAADGDLDLLNTVIQDNTQAGLDFQSCDLSLGNQAADNWRTLRNGKGISSDGSTLTLDNVTVEQSTGYAIWTTNSDIVVRNCQLTGRDGIYAGSNTSTTVESTHLVTNASGVTNWGIYRIKGDLEVTNTLVYGFQNGVYLSDNTNSTADVLNTTIVSATHYGIYQVDGPATLVNNVVVGDNAQYGIVKGTGSLTHTNNLLYGFGNPFYGTVAHTSEILKNPRFADAASGDYHLGKGSPGINVGLDLGIAVATDMEGNARPAHRAFDLGAYEFTQPYGSYRVLSWEEKK